MDWSAAAAFPAGLGGGEQVGEHQQRSRELATGSVWRGKGWRGELHGELGAAALMAAAAAVPGNRGSQGVALALRKEGGMCEDVVELAGMA